MVPTKILVGVDFSPSSDRALALAVELGVRVGASVMLIHVLELPSYSLRAITTRAAALFPEVEDAAKRSLEAARVRHEGAGLTLTSELVYGDPRKELVRVAHESGADLVVVGTHGAGALERFLLGSVAERVVRTSSCATLVVPRAPEA